MLLGGFSIFSSIVSTAFAGKMWSAGDCKAQRILGAEQCLGLRFYIGLPSILLRSCVISRGRKRGRKNSGPRSEVFQLHNGISAVSYYSLFCFAYLTMSVYAHYDREGQFAETVSRMRAVDIGATLVQQNATAGSPE